MKLSDIDLAQAVTYGNSKLPKTTMIFNITSATDCINRKNGQCQVPKGKCYAFRTENFRSNVKRFRRRQASLWQVITADEFIHQFNLIVKLKRNKVTKLRFDVSGDLRNQEDVEKVDAIAHELDIPVYLYTASSHLDLSGLNHAVVNCSNLDLWKRYRHKENFNYYMVVTDDTDVEQFESQGYKKCLNDCSICDLCSKSTGLIVQKLH